MRGPAQGAALALPPLALARLGWEQRWVTDDAFIAFIDLRIVQHLLAGHGPVYNLGQRVEAYTNPLWVLLLAALVALTAPFGALVPNTALTKEAGGRRRSLLPLLVLPPLGGA